MSENNTSVISIKDRRAKKNFERGFAAHSQGLIDEAIEFYLKSLAEKRTAETLTFLAWAISTRGEYEQSIQLCQEATELDPEYGNPYNDIGAYLIELGKDDEAIVWLEKAILAPKYTCRYYPYYNLGRIYAGKNLIKKAIVCYQKSLVLNTEFLPARRQLEILGKSLN